MHATNEMRLREQSTPDENEVLLRQGNRYKDKYIRVIGKHPTSWTKAWYKSILMGLSKILESV